MRNQKCPSLRRHFSWILVCALLLCGWQAAVVVLGEKEEHDDPMDQFFHACTSGQMEAVKKMIQEHPEYVNARSPDGESCLHVAGIYGQTGVTELILKAGGDPNVRSTFERGLRMTPLSWNVYAGHVETAEALLTGGASVNMDFDSMRQSDPPQKITVLDVILSILPPEKKGEEEAATTTAKKAGEIIEEEEEDPLQRHRKMKELLLKHGAKRYSDLTKQKEEL
jgi:ankyrin repeat protein